jgi:hypothetical protein
MTPALHEHRAGVNSRQKIVLRGRPNQLCGWYEVENGGTMMAPTLF